MVETDDVRWLTARFAPVVGNVRGRDLETKRRAVADLEPNERAAFAWYSFHMHADVATFRQLCELYVVDWGIWHEIEDAAARIGERRFIEICRRARTLAAQSRTSSAPPDEDAWRALSLSYRDVAPTLARAAEALVRRPSEDASDLG